MTKTDKGNFIEIEYIGKIKSNDKIFDLTDEKIAKENDIFDPNFKYGSIVICLGENSILKKLDSELIGKEVGKYTIGVSYDEGFGKKDAKLIRIIPLSVFKKKDINPFPGLQVSIDNAMWMVRSVSGGRCIVDFNHPLAGRDLVYEVTIKKIVIDDGEKLKSLIEQNLFLKDKDYSIDKEENKYKIVTEREIPDKVKEEFIDKVKRLISNIKDITIAKKEK